MDRVILGSSRVMGVIGDPIAQARTPAAINPLFAAMGANIVCVPLHVPVPALQAVWAGLKAMPNVVGFGITLPHKAAAFDLCDAVDPAARQLGVVNLVRREADGGFTGYNFDGQGFLRGLSAAGIAVAGRPCHMVGAGGAAMSIAFALAEAGAAEIVVTNRTLARAEALAERVNTALGRAVLRAAQVAPAPGALVINATSLGLRGGDPLPVDPAALHPGMTMAEVIAQPETTALLRAAQARGVQVHSGLRMIEGQVGMIAEHLAAAPTCAPD